jgi:hypothetical protein
MLANRELPVVAEDGRQGDGWQAPMEPEAVGLLRGEVHRGKEKTLSGL